MLGHCGAQPGIPVHFDQNHNSSVRRNAQLFKTSINLTLAQGCHTTSSDHGLTSTFELKHKQWSIHVNPVAASVLPCHGEGGHARRSRPSGLQALSLRNHRAAVASQPAFSLCMPILRHSKGVIMQASQQKRTTRNKIFSPHLFSLIVNV